MSPWRGLRDPVGPESPSTYWLRRGVVVGIIVLVILLVWWLVASLAGGSSSSRQADPQPSTLTPNPSWTDTGWATPSDSPSSASPSSSGSPSASGTPSPSAASPRPSGKNSSAAPASSAAPCSGSALNTSVSADSRRVKVNSPVVLHLTVTNGAAVPCVLDGSSGVQVTITSGADRIWSSADCPKWAPVTGATLAPGQTLKVDANWPGRRSGKKCLVSDEELRPGTYVAAVTAAGSGASKFVMQLVG